MKYVTSALCALMAMNSWACEVCGAVTSALGPGTIAAGNRHAIGLGYQFRNYHSQHPGILGLPDETSDETFQRFDLTGLYRISARWQLKGVIPMVSNKQLKNNQTTQRQGIGDPMLTAHYFVVNQSDTSGNAIRWSLGVGMKFPVGKYSTHDEDWLMLYPGTGSWDGLVQSSLYLVRGKWGIMQEGSVLIRTQNKYNYQQGNSYNTSLYGFRNVKSVTFLLGAQFAANSNDVLNGKRVSDSPVKGTSLSISAGVSYRWKNLLAQAYYHVPVYQYLGNGYVTQKTGLNVGVYYLFN